MKNFIINFSKTQLKGLKQIKQNKKTNPQVNNQEYYNQFAKIYENKRGRGYHQMIDDLEISIVSEHINKASEVLEVGCGTGLILKEVSPKVKRAVGIDLSENMLEKAKERGLEVYHSDASQMPFEDDSFDLVYSFKVLAHIEDIEGTLKEIQRVLKPEGIALLEFYNKYSMRTLIKKLKPSNIIAQQITDDSVYTRYDALSDIQHYLPQKLKLQDVKGIRIVTPAFFVHDLPILKDVFYRTEFLLKNTAFARFGGFMVVVLKKESV